MLGADLVGVAMALAPGKACYVPLRHGTEANDIVGGQGGLDFSATSPVSYPQIPFELAMDMLRPVFEDPAVLKIGHNLKYDSHVLRWPRNGGIKLYPVDDTMCLSYVLDGGRVGGHSMDYWRNTGWITIQLSLLISVAGSKQVPFGSLSPRRRWTMRLRMPI